MQSSCSHHADIMQSPCSHRVVSMQSPCSHYAVISQSPCSHHAHFCSSFCDQRPCRHILLIHLRCVCLAQSLLATGHRLWMPLFSLRGISSPLAEVFVANPLPPWRYDLLMWLSISSVPCHTRTHTRVCTHMHTYTTQCYTHHTYIHWVYTHWFTRTHTYTHIHTHTGYKHTASAAKVLSDSPVASHYAR
jgi:hypothetical protein